MYQERTYRHLVNTDQLATFQVVVKETDLMVHAAQGLVNETRELVLEHRGYVESYIKAHPDFAGTLNPWYPDRLAPNIIADMVKAGRQAGVGPMAAVAGAIAGRVGRGLLKITDQVVVENGGDVFIKTNSPVTAGIFAGPSPLSMQLGVRLGGRQNPVGVCTSSGTLGHSLSFGQADAVCVVADSCAVADAAATSIGNLIHSATDIQNAINAAQRMTMVTGIVIIAGEKIGVWGELELVPLKGKKG
jgi:ApbE superfamily uncharacterized protein (UPF0280 family)